MNKQQQTAVEKMVIAWGDDAPEWIALLAKECDKSNQKAVGREMGYSSGSIISQVLSRVYPADLSTVESAFKGAFMDSTCNCPVMGTIGTNLCIEKQRQPYANTNRQRIQLWQACRDGCSNFRGEESRS